MSPVLTVLPALLPSELQQAVWELTQRPCWLFGNVSMVGRSLPFWNMDLEGEPVFYDGEDIARAWLPMPNRALFFDSRIDHAGRPPSRAFGGLRVSIAFKLEVPR